LGTKEAVRELFKIYSKKDIVELFTNSMRGEWNKKSLNFWSLIFNVVPKNQGRQVK